MKKKIGIGIGIGVLVILIIMGLVIVRSFFSSKEQATEIEEDPYGIEYYVVPNMEQVFVNGIVFDSIWIFFYFNYLLF